MTMMLRPIALSVLIVLSATAHANSTGQDGQDRFDLTYTGDLGGMLPKLHQLDPQMTILNTGTPRNVPVTLRMTNVPKVDILREIGEQAGDKADLTYRPSNNSLKITYREAPKPVIIPRPDPVQRNADGSVIVMFGQAKPQLVCQALDPCAIELEAGEKINRLDVGDPVKWEISPSLVGEGNRRAIVIMVRATAPAMKTKLVLSTNRRIYSIILSSPSKATDESDSKMSFLYPAQS